MSLGRQRRPTVPIRSLGSARGIDPGPLMPLQSQACTVATSIASQISLSQHNSSSSLPIHHLYPSTEPLQATSILRVRIWPERRLALGVEDSGYCLEKSKERRKKGFCSRLESISGLQAKMVEKDTGKGFVRGGYSLMRVEALLGVLESRTLGCQGPEHTVDSRMGIVMRRVPCLPMEDRRM